MPKEHKKRGRRAVEKKRKLEQGEDEQAPKRHKHRGDHHVPEDIALPEGGEGDVEGEDEEYQPEEQQETNANGFPGDMPFYGMLDEEEQEYFKRADEMLELNQFIDAEDRSTFLANVYKEADGKELKLANSQSCSRLMERLIQLSTAAQLKSLFQKFSTHFLHLVQHRFASHCCEALFIQGAPVVSAELLASRRSNDADSETPMEGLYLLAIKELEGYLGFLMTDRFASHTLRVLLVVLSGQPLEQSAAKSVLQSRKKEHVSVTGTEQKLSLDPRNVPDSFMVALDQLISNSVSGLDTTYIRALASHQTGNPTIQLLLQIELGQFGKQKAQDENSIIHKLLPDNPITEENDSGKFINGMLYDPIGSRLLETIIEYAPGKTFKSIYRQILKQKLGKLAGNDVASYVVSQLLCRLSKDDLSDAMTSLCPHIHTLVERNRTAVIKTLIERCAVRGVDTAPIASALESAYGGPGNFEITHLLKLNKLEEALPSQGSKESTSKPHNSHQSAKLHGSLLAQAMITIPGPMSMLIFDSLAQLGTALSISLAKDAAASRTVQAALTAPTATVIFRRKMIQQFYGHIGEMTLDPSASRVIDAIWTGTHGLAFIRERCAEELAENENAIRESFVGRAVWRNWRMDVYKRKRRDWVQESRMNAGSDGFVGFPEAHAEKDAKIGKEREKEEGGGRHLTNIEKARLKFAKVKTEREKRAEKRERKDVTEGKAREVKSPSSGANTVAVS